VSREVVLMVRSSQRFGKWKRRIKEREGWENAYKKGADTIWRLGSEVEKKRPWS
jgi:hypothetical protein